MSCPALKVTQAGFDSTQILNYFNLGVSSLNRTAKAPLNQSWEVFHGIRTGQNGVGQFWAVWYWPAKASCVLGRSGRLSGMDLNSARNGHSTPAICTNQVSRIKQSIQAAKLQRLAFDAAQALGLELRKDGALKVTRHDAMALSQLVKAWDTAADRLRVLRGKGLPASERSKAK